jgi:hypothetical protein
MLHLINLLMSQDGQSFTCSNPDTSLECLPRCGSLDHLADTIGHRPLIDDHPYVPQVSVPSKQPRGSDEKWGLDISQ